MNLLDRNVWIFIWILLNIVAILIKYGSDYTIKNADRETALDLALEHGNPFMIEDLKQSITETGGDPEQAITKKAQ